MYVSPVVPDTSITLPSFKGVQYRLANNWFPILPLGSFQNHPIRYVEIGTFYGANLISVAQSYALHPESELHAIDIWADDPNYSEYQGKGDEIHSTFLKNIEESGYASKIKIHRNYSHRVMHTFEDESMDLIYIDGNHEPEYVLEDAVLSFRKLKHGGVLIFDDYGWGGPDLTQRGIDAFVTGYHKRIQVLGNRDTQVFIQKK